MYSVRRPGTAANRPKEQSLNVMGTRRRRAVPSFARIRDYGRPADRPTGLDQIS